MSARTRARGRPPTSAADGIRDAIQQARDLVPSSDQGDIKQVWEELCRQYLRALQAGLIHEAFPYWILHNISGHIIEQLTKVVYDKGTGTIKSYAPSLFIRFGVPEWHFNLFLGPLPQNKVKALNQVTKGRNDTFDDLYQELCRIRSQEQDLPDGPLSFTPREIKSCFQDNDSDDDSEADDNSDYQTSSGSGDDEIIYVTDGSEDNHHDDNEHNNADSFIDNFTNPVGHDPPTHVPDAQRSEADDTVILTTGQLGSDPRREAISSESFEASKVPNREQIMDVGVWDRTGAGTAQQLTLTDDTADQCLVEHRNYFALLEKLHEKLKHDQLAIARKESEASANIDEAIQELERSRSTCEPVEMKRAKSSILVDLLQKHESIETDRREYQLKRSECNADIDDLPSKRSRAS